jgi:hypothetical protein
MAVLSNHFPLFVELDIKKLNIYFMNKNILHIKR